MTHAGKDRLVKYWDADKFQLLLELQGHHAEVWAVVVSSLGDFIITAGHDRSFRRWERTEEPFFIEEERERRLESLFEADAEVCTFWMPIVLLLAANLICWASSHSYSHSTEECCGDKKDQKAYLAFKARLGISSQMSDALDDDFFQSSAHVLECCGCSCSMQRSREWTTALDSNPWLP